MIDLAALTSSYVIGAQDDFDPRNLGFAKQVKVNEWYTSILDGNNDEELIEDIIYDIKEILSDDDNSDETLITKVDRKFHKKRFWLILRFVKKRFL